VDLVQTSYPAMQSAISVHQTAAPESIIC
jgi:hypothetical protein